MKIISNFTNKLKYLANSYLCKHLLSSKSDYFKSFKIHWNFFPDETSKWKSFVEFLLWQQFQSLIHEKLQNSVLNAKINAIISSIYSIVKVNGFTYIYTYTFNPTPGGRGREVGG